MVHCLLVLCSLTIWGAQFQARVAVLTIVALLFKAKMTPGYALPLRDLYMPVSLSYRQGRAFQQSQGFTLVELIVGIVLFSVSLVTVVSVIMPQTRKAIDPIWQVRGVTLAQ